MYKAALALLVGLILSVSGSAWSATTFGNGKEVYRDGWFEIGSKIHSARRCNFPNLGQQIGKAHARFKLELQGANMAQYLDGYNSAISNQKSCDASLLNDVKQFAADGFPKNSKKTFFKSNGAEFGTSSTQTMLSVGANQSSNVIEEKVAKEAFERGLAKAQKQDYLSAFEIWKVAADRGHGPSATSLAELYIYGLGVQEDTSEAIKYLNIANDSGYTRAKSLLGGLYYWGKKIQKNYTVAIPLLMQAGKDGDADRVLVQFQ